MYRLFLVLAVSMSLAGGAVLAQTPYDGTTAAVLSRLDGGLARIRDQIAYSETAPEHSRFKRDQADIQRDLNKLLDEILITVVGEVYRSKRAEVMARDIRIASIRKEIADLDVARARALPSPAQLSLVDRTLGRDYASGSIEDFDARIEAAKASQHDNEAENRKAFSDLARDLRITYGLEINADQAQSLLYQINGNSIIDMRVAYVVLNNTERRLGELRNDASNDETVRRYYGMAAALRLVSARLHEAHLQRYDGEWLPRLADLEAEHRKLIAETEANLARETDPGNRANYQDNLRIQGRISDAMAGYRARLERQQETVRARLVSAQAYARLALNTLKTLESASNLSQQMFSSSEEFQALLEINTSDLIPLSDDEIDELYLDLSIKLAVS